MTTAPETRLSAVPAPAPMSRRLPAGTWTRVAFAVGCGVAAGLFVSAILPGPPKPASPASPSAARQQPAAPAAALQQSRAARHPDAQGPGSAPRNLTDDKQVRWDDNGVAVWGLDLEGQRVKNVAPGNLVRVGGPEGELFFVAEGGFLRPYQP